MDQQIFTLINNFAFKNYFLDQIEIFSTRYLFFLLFAVAVLVVFKNGKRAIIAGFFSLVLVLLSDKFLNLIIPQPRPFVVETAVKLLVKPPLDSSFPSTHAAISAAAATLIFYFSASRLLRAAGIVVAVLVGFSRIFVGVHYPSDVLLGWVLGFFLSTIAVKLTSSSSLSSSSLRSSESNDLKTHQSLNDLSLRAEGLSKAERLTGSRKSSKNEGERKLSIDKN